MQLHVIRSKLILYYRNTTWCIRNAYFFIFQIWIFDEVRNGRNFGEIAPPPPPPPPPPPYLVCAVCHFVTLWPLVGLDLSYSTTTLKLGQIWQFFASCDLEILWMTLKNRAPLLCPFKLYASFRSHRWIAIRVTVRKRTNWVLTSVTLTFDLWPWPFEWTSVLSMVITPENFMMIRWQEHSEKGVTAGRTDGRTRPFIELLGRS